MSDPSGGRPEGPGPQYDEQPRNEGGGYGDRDRYDRRPDYGPPPSGGGYHSHGGGRYGEPPRGGYGGPPPPGKTWKPGDWTCPMCQSHCFASRDSCFRCGAARPDGRGMAPPAGYGPPPGGFGGYGPPPGGYGGYGPPAAVAMGLGATAPVYYARPPPPQLEGGYGDAVAWGRGPVQDGNYPQRYEVFEYQPTDNVTRGVYSREPAETGGMGPSYGGHHGGGGGGGGARPFRQGDWNCPKCQAHNFASRMACFRCGASKVHDS